jgi:hypothetical protein
METPIQESSRMLQALEELIEQEGMYLRGGYYDLAVQVRDRAAPLVQRLIQLDGQTEVATLRPRVDVLLAKSTVHATFLSQKMSELKAEIDHIERVRHRNARMRPAYGRVPSLVPSGFQATG